MMLWKPPDEVVAFGEGVDNVWKGVEPMASNQAPEGYQRYHVGRQ